MVHNKGLKITKSSIVDSKHKEYSSESVNKKVQSVIKAQDFKEAKKRIHLHDD